LLRSIATTATSATGISFCTLCAACERQWRFSIEALHWAEDTTGATVAWQDGLNLLGDKPSGLQVLQAQVSIS
jgi:hypothetical protein